MDMKSRKRGKWLCKVCGELKTRSLFHVQYGVCIQCFPQQAIKILWKNKENERKRRDKIKARPKVRQLTEGQYQAKLLEQNGKCAICGAESTTFNVRLCADHIHSTGEHRGLLCRHCNSMLGYARDNIETLLQAIEYLKKYS